jgi:L-threonylcarbamoyladenylate synthase
MRIITKEEFWTGHVDDVRNGKVFIYPTDTVYGIGCDATNPAAVKKARRIKKTKHPFSVIAPSKSWILKNCKLGSEAKRWLAKLPGPYTLILTMKRKCVAPEVSFGKSLGIRIPNYWTKEIARRLDMPIITTSANISGKPTIKDKSGMKGHCIAADFFIDAGVIDGKPSTIVDLTGKRAVRLR